MTVQGASFGLITTHFQTDPILVGLPVIAGLEDGVAEIGATVMVLGSGAIQWRLNGVAIPGATNMTLVVPPNEGAALSVSVDAEASLPADIRHPEPVAAGALINQSFERVTGVQTYDVSGDFSFAGTAFYTLSSPMNGVSVASATGIVSFDTDVLSLQSSTSVTVRCADAGAPGRFAESQFDLSIVDTSAPVLSQAIAAANGTNDATGSVVTDEAGGQIFWVLTESATTPSVAQILAGQTHTGTPTPASGAQNVSNTGVQALSPAPTGLTAGTTYVLHLVHEDAAGNRSTRLSSASFTTDAGFTFSFTEGATGEAELFADGMGQITITAPSVYAGTYAVNLSQLASGPLNLVPPALLGGNSADVGDVLTYRPGLWLYDSAGATPVTSQNWQADSGSGFANISGTTGTSFTVTSAQDGDDIRIRETLNQSGIGSNAANSDAASVASSGGGGSSLRGVTDTFLETMDGTVMSLPGLDIGTANATRRVGAIFVFRAFRTITSVTIGGVAATVDTVITGEVVQLAVAYATVPTGSSADLVVTFNNSAAGIAGAIFTFDASDSFTAFPVVRDVSSPVDLSNTVSANGAFLLGIVSGEDDNGNLTGWTWTGLGTEHLTGNFTGSSNPFNPASVASQSNVPAGPRTIQAAANSEADTGISVGLLVELS